MNKNNQGTLHKYFMSNSGKRITKWYHYFDLYEHYLSRFIDKKPVMLEIGVAEGGSLVMWRDYLGEGCKIIGLDINKNCKKHEGKDIEVFIGSQDDQGVIKNILSKYPKIDIVIDDGSHLMDHMRRSFKLIYSNMSENGIYLIEDIQTCYQQKYGGGLKSPESFVEFAKNKIDELNALYTDGEIPVNEFTCTTQSISFHDGMVVFEKKLQGLRHCSFTKGFNAYDFEKVNKPEVGFYDKPTSIKRIEVKGED